MGVSLLALPMGTGPGLLPRTGGVGICKHLEGPTWQPLNTKPYQLVVWAGHSPVLGVRTENRTLLLGKQRALWLLGQEIPALLV